MSNGDTNPTPVANPLRVLVYDHSNELREAITSVLAKKGNQVAPCSNPREVSRALENSSFEVMVTHSRTGQVTGADMIDAAKERCPHLEVVMISGTISLDAALEAIQHHVYEVLELPVDTARLERTVRNAGEHGRMAQERERLLEELNRQNEILERQVRTVTRELREKSLRDELTGLYNYRHFMKVLDGELSRAQRYDRTLTLAMLDLDHFKRLNDSMGHLKGNEVLARVGQILSDGCRTSDMAARYGGEEFALILPETTKNAAKHIVDRIRINVEELGITYTSEEDPNSKVTISAGIASMPEDGLLADQVIRKADAALYTAKESGRNCLCLAR